MSRDKSMSQQKGSDCALWPKGLLPWGCQMKSGWLGNFPSMTRCMSTHAASLQRADCAGKRDWFNTAASILTPAEEFRDCLVRRTHMKRKQYSTIVGVIFSALVAAPLVLPQAASRQPAEWKAVGQALRRPGPAQRRGSYKAGSPRRDST